MEAIIERYVALDVHKRYCMVGAVDREQHVVMPPRKVAMDALEGWAKAHLSTRDAVVFEASVNAWALYDLLQPVGSKNLIRACRQACPGPTTHPHVRSAESGSLFPRDVKKIAGSTDGQSRTG